MIASIFTIRPLSPFGTPLAGDSLFGQLCWALALRRGKEGLEKALAGYDSGMPFAVVSDGFPSGLLPRPTLPAELVESGPSDPKLRKQIRNLKWLPSSQANLPVRDWVQKAVVGDAGMLAARTQNTINRHTGTTGRGIFAPRQVEQIVFKPETRLDIHTVHDPAHVSTDELQGLLTDIGLSGFGRDASTGLGKFEVECVNSKPAPGDFLHAMTLAPCAPDASTLDETGCWWQPVTRFGRHGSTAALGAGGGPFKRPVLLARTGAVLKWHSVQSSLFHGTGLGGASRPISGVIPGTVHQGYAPVIPLIMGQ
jgi:CRISPR-associated protein Csm4